MIQFDADLTGLNQKAKADGEGAIHRTAIPALVAEMTPDRLRDTFGEETALMAFSGLREDGTIAYKSVTPDVVHGVHDCTVSGLKFRGAPVVAKITPASALNHVAVHIKIPFERDTYRDEANALSDLLGTPGLSVEMEPVQQSLDLDGPIRVVRNVKVAS